MMRILEILQEPFPYYLNSDRKNTWFAVGLSLFVIIFLTLFLPMEWMWFRKWLLIGAIILVVLYSHIIWFPKIWPNVFDPDRWTVGKYIAFTLWQLMVMGIIASLLIHALGFHPDLSLWMNMYYYFISQTMYGGVAIIIFTFIIRDVMLKNSLRNALHANQDLEKIRNLRHGSEEAELPATVTIYSDTSETVAIHLPDLLYIEASDNYSTLYWKNGDTLEKKMLRVNLKNMEAQLNNSFIIRCHRSYAVNINAVTQVVGNTNGYKLSVRDTEFTVPVSRSKGREVIEKIEQIRNLAETA
jgi:hypothetical protein